MTRLRRLARDLARLLLPALLFGAVSCAYYNTFYIAKKSFRQAEESVAKNETDKTPVDAQNSYRTTIQQSRKVLINHPKSRWADDAIYLMGASYYGMGDYDSSLASVQLLMSRFPKSSFYADALFLSGMCYTKKHEYDLASAFFDSVLTGYPEYKRTDQILFTMAETAAEQRNTRAAVGGYERLGREFPKSRVSIESLRRVGNIHFEAGRYDSASIAYGKLLSLAKEGKDRIEAGLLQAQALIKLNKPEEALRLLRELEPPEATVQPTPPPSEQQASGERAGGQAPAPAAVSAELGDQIARLRLGEAAALTKLGRYPEAQGLLQEVVQRFAQSNYAVEAQFQIGYTYETQMDSLEAARAAYDKAAQLPGRSVFRDQAAQRSKALQAQIDLEKQAGAGDAEADQRAAAALRVAEILLLDRELVDEAVDRYQTVERDFPESRSAPRAAYALAYIRWKKQGDSLGAQTQLRELVQRYPASTQARGAIALLAAQGADTAGLGELLRTVVPESTATTTPIPQVADSVSAPRDSISVEEQGRGFDAPRGTETEDVGPLPDTRKVPEEEGGVVRRPRGRQRGSEQSYPFVGPPVPQPEEGPQPPESGSPPGRTAPAPPPPSDGQLPPPPSPVRSGGKP
jgi:TolA-binding protein